MKITNKKFEVLLNIGIGYSILYKTDQGQSTGIIDTIHKDDYVTLSDGIKVLNCNILETLKGNSNILYEHIKEHRPDLLLKIKPN